MELAPRPHRGSTALALGILGLLSPIGAVVAAYWISPRLSWILILALMSVPVIAWVLGSNEVSGIDKGRVDPAGRGLAQIGRVLGFLGTCLALVLIILVLGMAPAPWSGANR